MVVSTCDWLISGAIIMAGRMSVAKIKIEIRYFNKLNIIIDTYNSWTNKF